MTRAANYQPLEYVENGSTLTHAISPWVFQTASEIQVSRRSASTGLETLLVQGSDYTVAGGGGSTGQVNKTNGGTAGNTIVIRRITARDQAAHYVNGDAFPAETHEGALDHLAQVDQEQEVKLADALELAMRALLVPDGEGGAIIPGVVDRKGLYLKFDPTTGAPIAANPAAESASPSVTIAFTELAAGTPGYFTIAGTWPNLTWNIGLPRGPTGASGALSDGTFGGIVVSSGGTVLNVGNGHITLARMAALGAGTIIGNNTGGSATPIALSAAQVTAMLDLATTSAKGLGPARPASNSTLYFLRGDGNYAQAPLVIPIACSDEGTALTAGAGKVTFRMPCGMVLDDVRASLTTAQTSGGLVTIDVQESGVSIFSTKLTINNGAKTSTTATTPRVISDANLADDAEIKVNIDGLGDGTAKGLKIYLIGRKAS